jgi:kynureninase
MKSQLDEAIQLDYQDPFKSLAHLFDMPLDKKGDPAIYLNGNSLGPKPKSINAELLQEVRCAWSF